MPRAIASSSPPPVMHELALLALHDGRAGVLAHGQDAAGGDGGVLQQVERDEAIVGRGLGVVEDRRAAAGGDRAGAGGRCRASPAREQRSTPPARPSTKRPSAVSNVDTPSVVSRRYGVSSGPMGRGPGIRTPARRHGIPRARPGRSVAVVPPPPLRRPYPTTTRGRCGSSTTRWASARPGRGPVGRADAAGHRELPDLRRAGAAGADPRPRFDQGVAATVNGRLRVILKDARRGDPRRRVEVSFGASTTTSRSTSSRPAPARAPT